MYKEAKGVYPAIPGIDALISRVEKKIADQEAELGHRRKAEELKNRGEQSENAGNYRDALRLYGEAKGVYPAIPGIDALISRVEKKIADQEAELGHRRKAEELKNRGEQSENAGNYRDALRLYGEAKGVYPAIPGIDALISRVEKKIADQEADLKRKALEGDVNRALRGKGLKDVYAEVNKDLVATLKGSVNKADDKTVALTVARAYKELKEVRDNIEVKPPLPPPPPPPDPGRLEAEINRALRARGLKDVYAEVNKDLIATMWGSVSKPDDKTVAMNIARSFKDFKELRDNIQVNPPPKEVPFLTPLNIVSPNPKFPKEIVAFSGLWEGAWNGTIPSRLAIEKINLQEATVVYGVAQDPRGNFKADCYRKKADVIASDELQWGGGDNPRFNFRMSKDLKTITGRYEYKGQIFRITMVKKE